MKCNEHSRLHEIKKHLRHTYSWSKRYNISYRISNELVRHMTPVGSEHIKQIISMPRKNGGLNIIDPCQGAAQEYSYSLSVSEPEMQEIGGMEAEKMQDRIRQGIKADKQNRIHQISDDLKSASDELLTIIENARKFALAIVYFYKEDKSILRSQHVFEHSPVIHCSAGIGRSGTFAFVDIVLTLLAASEGCNSHAQLMNILHNLRNERPGLIQTPEQLRFCFLSIIRAFCDVNMKINPKWLKVLSIRRLHIFSRSFLSPGIFDCVEP
ncbi:hypothetical protein GJ496_008373 [Pomphorhynchus laevis]|nr:hypothetical protein GJ496_008373 [Pomphorhynchus laevis]